MVVCDEIEDVFFEVGARAGDEVDFVLTDHFGQGDAELRCAHGTGERDHHLAAIFDVLVVAFGSIH